MARETTNLHRETTPNAVIRSIPGNRSAQHAVGTQRSLKQAELGESQALGDDEDPTRDFVVAAIAAGIGGVATIGTYAAAGAGETFYVLWGAALYGGARFLRGALKVLRHPVERTPRLMATAATALAIVAFAAGATIYTLSNRGSNEADEIVRGLHAGDCVRGQNLLTGGEVLDMEQVSCSETGALKVTRVVRIVGYTEYPGVTQFDSIVAERCLASTATYTYPTEEGWKAGDRQIVCLSD